MLKKMLKGDWVVYGTAVSRTSDLKAAIVLSWWV